MDLKMTTNKPSAVIPELFAYEGTAMNSFFKNMLKSKDMSQLRI